jgi:LacI family transcriptional regulator
MSRDGTGGVTLDDVARRAGVSLATASRALNGGSRRVSAQLEERVLRAAQELRYVPNAQAQALASARTLTVGMIVRDVADPYFAEIAAGALAVADASERLVLLCNTYHDRARELEYVSLLRAQQVGGLIFAGSGFDDRDFSRKMAAQVEAFAARAGHPVFIGRHHVPGDCVLPDNLGGARALARAIVDLGHTRIGVISGPAAVTSVVDRMSGIEEVLRERGTPLAPEAVVGGDFTREAGFAAAHKLLERVPELTAIVALNDAMAVGALAALRERGIDIPGGVSLAGFDDVPSTRDVTPALTTVRVELRRLGGEAMKLALEPQQAEIRLVHVPTEVVLRDSTAPPRRRA